MLTEAARTQMADLDRKHNLAVRAAMELDVAAQLADDHPPLTKHVFTTWQAGGRERDGLLLENNRDDRMVRLLEVIPDVDACIECGRHPRKMRTTIITVPHADVIEVRDISPAGRVGWANKLLRAAIDGNSISTDRGRQLVGWAVTMGRGA